MTLSGRKAVLIALAIAGVVSTGCQDTTEPVISRLASHNLPPPAGGYYQYCRRWPQGGTATKWVTAEQTWIGPCAVQVQSSPGTMMSATNPQTMTFQFTGPVVNVMIQTNGAFPAPCPTVTLTARAYNGETLVDSASFEEGCSDSPRSDDHYHNLGPITKLVITPPEPMPSTGAQFYIHYYVPCPPTGDPILDDPGVRDQLKNELARSRPNPDGTGKKEYGGYVYQRDDGTYFLVPANDLTATDCGFTIPAGSPPTIAGAHYAGRFYHTHPSYDGERLYGCSWAKPTDIVTVDRDPKHGGGSPPDWAAVDSISTPGYVIDLDDNVYRLDPGTPVNQRGSNPNHWRYDGSEDKCLVLA